jgi:hypothetical protein
MYVEVEQTGPVNVKGDVEYHHLLSQTAIYYAIGGYNGCPILQSEEKITGTSWTYGVTVLDELGKVIPEVSCNPKSGDVSAVIIRVLSTKKCFYFVNVSMTLTFKITKYKKDGVTMDLERTVVYNAASQCAGDANEGKLKIKFVPVEDFPMRNYTSFGLGETGHIVAETTSGAKMFRRESGQARSGNNTVCKIVDFMNFAIQTTPGNAFITVNGTMGMDEEPVSGQAALLAILPSSIHFVKESEEPLPNNEVGASVRGRQFLSPTNVSFVNLMLKEANNSKATVTGSQSDLKDSTYYTDGHNTRSVNRSPHGRLYNSEEGITGITGGDPRYMNNGCQWNGVVSIVARGRPLNVGKGTFKWQLPIQYEHNYVQGGRNVSEYKDTGISGFYSAEFDGEGGCMLRKHDINIKRFPKNKDNYSAGFEYEYRSNR